MISTEAIPALELRIYEEQLKRDALLAGGNFSKYVEACSKVEAFVLKLEPKFQSS